VFFSVVQTAKKSFAEQAESQQNMAGKIHSSTKYSKIMQAEYTV
jgi:hypothetical protein